MNFNSDEIQCKLRKALNLDDNTGASICYMTERDLSKLSYTQNNDCN